MDGMDELEAYRLKMLAQTDQAGESGKGLAAVLAAYFKALLACDFTRQEALVIIRDWQITLARQRPDGG